MDQRLKKMERQLAVKRGSTSKRARKRQNRAKAVKEEARADARKQAKEYLEGEGNNWAARLQDGLRGTRFTAMESSNDSTLQVGIVTADELQRKRAAEEREQVAARAATAKQRVEEAWAEAEAKRVEEQAEAAHKRALKQQRKAERAAQQKALSFSLVDEEDI
eukprot:COSAG02_NODE_2914_length_7755_cov_1036.500000_1_plen_163_part_00